MSDLVLTARQIMDEPHSYHTVVALLTDHAPRQTAAIANDLVTAIAARRVIVLGWFETITAHFSGSRVVPIEVVLTGTLVAIAAVVITDQGLRFEAYDLHHARWVRFAPREYTTIQVGGWIEDTLPPEIVAEFAYPLEARAYQALAGA